MGDQSEGSIVLELVDVVATLTRQHGALLEGLRSLRAGLSDGAIFDSDQPPPPRTLLPPPPPTCATLLTGLAVETLPPRRVEDIAPEAAVVPVGPRTTQIADKQPVHVPTKRTYDYFAELDDLITRLPAGPSRHESFPPTNP